MKTLNEIIETANNCFDEVRSSGRNIEFGDFILVSLDACGVEYFNKKEDMPEYIHPLSAYAKFVIKEKNGEVKPVLQYDFKNIEGCVEIFDDNMRKLYNKCRMAKNTINESIKKTLLEKIGVEEEGLPMFQSLGIKSYENEKDIERLTEDTLISAGFIEEQKENEYLFSTPFCKFRFVYLEETGLDDSGDVCSNRYGVLFTLD